MHASPELSPRTFGNEDLLPRVPLPTLEETRQRFLEWCSPLLTEEQVAATEAALADFAAPDGPGPVLHAALQRYDATEGVHSWLDEFWEDRYLGRRDRIALNANFFFLFADSAQGQVARAAGLVAGALAYKLLIDAEELAPAVQRGRPLSMEQNRYLFSACRIPGELRDTARTPYTAEWPGPSRERHIVVFHRGNAYRLDVIGEDGAPHTVEEIEAGLRAVTAASEVSGPGPGVGALTTKARAEWARSRARLLDHDPRNRTALDTVETALLCVCLEDSTPAGPREAGDQLLHGDSRNRWFDKSISLIVFADGTAGYNGEHCRLDGTTVIAFLDTLLSRPAHELSRTSGARSQGAPDWAPVEFALDDDLRADIDAAAVDFTAYAADTASATVAVEGFGAERAKQRGMSPDAFAQMSFQLAHHRSRGRIGATYESIATRQFRNGRTEAMRVVTPEVVRFVDAMADPGADAATRRAALRAAADAHVRRARECQAGDAPEQHLWELQMIARRHGAELGVTGPLPLYESPGWLVMRDDYLSTSAVPSPHVRYWGFGSTSLTCIGVGYALLGDRFHIYLSTPRSVRAQMTAFAAELPRAVHELDALLAGD
ncbi:choline/carnitine O-acyltransferase [Pseudonocardia humida]|uniref:Choline/carnitine O-acyltransferase n=1 Tax=Pseudonocardia humida TaxID=2800819 RepID=A0ABT1A9E0_9PSEU|nr:choline/carnitine O-acyltransferase [Pseudonocardia humida]MCO1659555.1 choline/carnitine O-acyltransferase [Pseudonocardia humida]